MSDPDVKTKKELQEVLREEMQDILRNNITIQGLRTPASLEFQDVIANRHLYERLGIAMAALGALNGYADQPKGFLLKEE